jgi:hypothetical protein
MAEGEQALYELFTPFWGFIVMILKNSKVLAKVIHQDEVGRRSSALVFFLLGFQEFWSIIRESVLKNVEWLVVKTNAIETKQYITSKVLNLL